MTGWYKSSHLLVLSSIAAGNIFEVISGLPPGSTGLNRSSSTTLTNSTSVGSSPNIMDFTGTRDWKGFSRILEACMGLNFLGDKEVILLEIPTLKFSASTFDFRYAYVSLGQAKCPLQLIASSLWKMAFWNPWNQFIHQKYQFMVNWQLKWIISIWTSWAYNKLMFCLFLIQTFRNELQYTSS